MIASRTFAMIGFLDIRGYSIHIYLQLGTRTICITLCLGIDIIYSITLDACRSISSNRMALIIPDSYRHGTILFSIWITRSHIGPLLIIILCYSTAENFTLFVTIYKMRYVWYLDAKFLSRSVVRTAQKFAKF